MERAVLVAFGVLAMVLVAALGAGLGIVYVSSDPAVQAERYCASNYAWSAPGAGCLNFHITSRSADHVEFTFDRSDGEHCEGQWTVHRKGPFGLLGTTGGGGFSCRPPGQPAAASGPPVPTPFPDGSLPCSGKAVVFSRPDVAEDRLRLTLTNGGATACDVAGPAKLLFLDRSGHPLPIPEQPASEPATPISLPPGGSAVYDFDFGGGPCYSPARAIVVVSDSSQPLPAPETVCGPLTAHAARAAS